MNTTKEIEFDYETYTRENAPDPAQIRRGPEAHKKRREAFRERLNNHANMEIKHAREMRHVFVSYCHENKDTCLLYTSPSPRDRTRSRMPSSA